MYVTLPELALESSPGSVSSCLSFCTSVCAHLYLERLRCCASKGKSNLILSKNFDKASSDTCKENVIRIEG